MKSGRKDEKLLETVHGTSYHGRKGGIAMDEMAEQLKQEGFTARMLQLIAPKLSEIMELTREDRELMRQRLEEILSEDEKSETPCRKLAETPQKEWMPNQKPQTKDDLYEAFGNTMTRILQKNNEDLMEKMDVRIAQRIMKEMNYLFRERENLEEERYRKLDRTIRDYQTARQQTALEEERRRLLKRYGFLRR